MPRARRESFTGGLGTAAFLAFLMAIVEKERAATEYALLSSVFALSRSVAGWVGGLGAQSMGYANWFLLTFFLGSPPLLLLPWVRSMLDRETRVPGLTGPAGTGIREWHSRHVLSGSRHGTLSKFSRASRIATTTTATRYRAEDRARCST